MPTPIITKPKRDAKRTTYEAHAYFAGKPVTLWAERRHDNDLGEWHVYQRRGGCRFLGESALSEVLVYIAANVPTVIAVKSLLIAVLETAKGVDDAGDLILDAEAIRDRTGRPVEDYTGRLGWRGSRLVIEWEGNGAKNA